MVIKKGLSDEQKHVMFSKGTEAPYSGDLLYNEEDGDYLCANCDKKIFDAATKFDGGCGWPSFYDVGDKDNIKLSEDSDNNMRRVEVSCANCGAHLGHVFNDAPDQPTGLRFCINSVAMEFKMSGGSK